MIDCYVVPTGTSTTHRDGLRSMKTNVVGHLGIDVSQMSFGAFFHHGILCSAPLRFRGKIIAPSIEFTYPAAESDPLLYSFLRDISRIPFTFLTLEASQYSLPLKKV
jgi:hypothetical protein